jgi:small-conductance mechanosensitive channel
MNPSQSNLLQMQALREALERSARATYLAEEHTVRTLSDLRTERARVRELDQEINRLNERYAALLMENRRLRNLVGQACQDRNSLSNEVLAILKELKAVDGDQEPPANEQRRNAA